MPPPAPVPAKPARANMASDTTKPAVPPPWSAATLYALVSGHNETGATQGCFFCGGPCAAKFPAGEYQSMLRVRPGDRFVPRCINSDVICKGCHLSLRDNCTIAMPPLLGGNGKPRVAQMRAVRDYSWVIQRPTPGNKIAGAVACNHAADMMFLRNACLAPPPPPYAIVIADQDEHGNFFHSLHRGAAVRAKGDPHVVYFRGDNLKFDPAQLKNLIRLAGMVFVACHEVKADRHEEACANRYVNGDQVYRDWRDASHDSPLANLAIFLCHSLEQCRELYPLEAKPEPKKV